MAIARTGSLLCAALASAPALAQWTPAWIGSWQYAPSPRGVTPHDVRLGAHGRIFTLLDAGHDGMSRTALARFDEGGAFAWLRERPGSTDRGMALLPDGGVAVVDAFGPMVRVRVHDGDNGDVVWEDDTQPGRISAGTRQLAAGADGDVLVPVIDGNDIVVARHAGDGRRLPDWRWSPGAEDLQAEDIVATADGGAVVGVAGDMLTGGYLVVRFDASGQVVFHDRELGTLDGGTFNRRLFLALDGADNVLAQGSLQNPFGDMQAQVWKIAPDGSRLWTRRLANPVDERFGIEAVGLALDAAGDALTAAQPGFGQGLRLQRFDSATGTLRQDVPAPLDGDPRGLARAPNGRVLVNSTYSIDFQGHVGARVVEFDARLRPCRSLDLGDRYFHMVSSGGPRGWTSVAASLFAETGNDAYVLRHDADGACDAADTIFADDFEGAAMP